MASRPGLDVWLYGIRVGVLTEPKYGKMRFDYTEEAEARFTVGSPALSTSMPVDAGRRPRGDIVRSFFTALLPEGDARWTISDEFSVRRGDYFGLISAIGRDCAGAVVIQPIGSPPPGTTGSVDPLADSDIERLVARIKERPLGADAEMRVSLPGAQEKLLLARGRDGRWGRPINGEPSTHILKPQDMRLDSYASAEAFCLGAARRLGLTNVDADVVEIAGRPVVVVSRYDRQQTAQGVFRIHQEDACQSLGVDCADNPSRKYQAGGGPAMKTFARVLSDHAPSEDRLKLLALTTLNVVAGNADAHARNLSIVHLSDGTTRLAPAYDITPTSFYKGVPTSDGPKDMSDKLGMWINNKRVIHDVTAEDIASEGASWGLSGSEATKVVEDTITRLKNAIHEEAEEVAIPAEMLQFISQRAEALGDGDRAGAAAKRSVPAVAPAPAAHQPRRPAGTPAGGQFASGYHPESNIALELPQEEDN